MKRKRYVKLIMSETGMQRNAANEFADIAVKNYGSYQKAYDMKTHLIVFDFGNKVVTAVNTLISGMKSVLLSLAHNIIDALGGDSYG